MKNIFITFALAAAMATSVSSCSDFLEQPVLGQENLDTYFQNEAECLKQLTGCYQTLAYNDWWQIYNFYITAEMCTDDMWMGNTTQDAGRYRDFAHYTGNSQTDGTQNYWQYRYKGILCSNIVIERVPNSPMSNESLRNRIIAEAKVLRAYHYFELVRNFGGVPLILSMVMPEEANGLTRSSVSETYAQIEKDLEESIPHLPTRSQYSASDMGRIAKGTAQGILGKVYLTQAKYSEAETVLSQVISSGEYELLPEFGQVWSVEHNNSKEGLLEIQTKFDETYNLGQRISVICASRDDSGWSWGLPTSHLEKAFLDAGDSERLRWTIIKHNATHVPGDPTWSDENPYIISPDKHKSGRTSRKLFIPKEQRAIPFDSAKNPLNYRLLRYADVLLMQAEVKNALNKDGEARDLLNQVRRRAKLDNASSSLTGTALRDAIRLERRLELALENNRLYDLRRWTDDNGKKAICNVMGENGSFVRYNMLESTDEYETVNQKENSNKGYNFREDRDQLFPIPHSEISMSEGSIQQNPNYN